MNSLTLFTTVALAHLLAVMSPGPDFAMVTRQTLAYGRAAGVWTALGIASGIVFHVAWGMFGLGWVVRQWAPLLELLRYAGAAFLIYMGVQALRAPPHATNSANGARAEPGHWTHHYGIGVLTNLLNPKAMLFFVALCSAVITTATPVGLRVALGLWIVGSTAAWFCFVSFTLGHAAVRNQLLQHAHWIDRAMGAILLALGLAMLVVGLRH